VSGTYPAFFPFLIPANKSVEREFRKLAEIKGHSRNVLVIGQFTGAVFLIIATAFVVKQLRFMQEQDPGFSRDQVVIIPLNSLTNPKYDATQAGIIIKFH
jgi:putative ABC transport system permease protein